MQQDGHWHLYGSSPLAEGISQSGQRASRVVDRRERIIQDLPILGKQVYLHISVRKFALESGQRFWEQLSFAGAKSHCSRRLEAHIFQSCQGADMSYVARQLGLGQDTVTGIFQRYAQKN